MLEMILMEPIDLTIGGAAPGPALAVSRGAGAANLITNDPREVWQDSAVASAVNFDIDLGANTAWDTIVLLNTNAHPTGSLWVVSTGTASYTTTTLLTAVPRATSEDVLDATGPAFFYSPGGQNTRYIRLAVTQPSGQANLTCGGVLVGKSWKPSFPRERGAGRIPLDTGSRQRLQDGSLAVVSGKLVSGFSWTFADLDYPDLAALWGIFRRRRTTERIVLVEDPEATVYAEEIHYGTLTDLQKFERNDATKSRWVLSMEDWI